MPRKISGGYLTYTLIEDVEHGAFLIEADLHSQTRLGIHKQRDVADDDTESDRHQQQRFPFLDYAQGDEHQADTYHYQMLGSHVGKAGELPELTETFDNVFH